MRYLFLLSLFLFPFYYVSAETDQEIKSELNSFLIKLGYEDYSENISTNIANNTGWGPLGQKTLKFTKDRYQIFNYTRELAVELLSEMTKNPNDQRIKNNLVDFTTQMLVIKPWNRVSRSELEEAIKNIPEDKVKDVAYEFISKRLSGAMTDHAKVVIADAVGVLYSVEELKILNNELKANGGKPKTQLAVEMNNRINRLETLVSKIIGHMYLDSEMGQSKEAGRALALGIARHSKLAKDPELFESLTAKTKEKGSDIRNFVGTSLVFKHQDEKGKIVEKVLDSKTGDFWNERTREGEAGQIVGAVSPAPQNRGEAYRKGLLGLIVSGFIYPGDPGPDLVSALRVGLAERKLFTSGFSHIGIGKAYEADGISTYRVLDTYPSSNPFDSNDPSKGTSEGSIRIVGVEQFAGMGPMMRVGRTRYDSEAFRKWAREQIRDRGYQKEVFYGNEYPKNEEGEEDRTKAPEKVVWNNTLTENEFHEFHNLAVEMPVQVKNWLYELAQIKKIPNLTGAFIKAISTGGEFVSIPPLVKDWLKKENFSGLRSGLIKNWLIGLRDETLKENPVEISKWFSKVMEKSVAHIQKDYLEKKGLPFATGFTNGYDLYCTKNVWLSILQATGIDPQKYRDRWSWKMKLARVLGVPAATKLDTGVIFSPSTFAWHREFTHGKEGKFDRVDYPDMYLRDQYAAVTMPEYRPKNEAILRMITEDGLSIAINPKAQIAGDLEDAVALRILGEGYQSEKARKTSQFRSGGVSRSHILGLCNNEFRSVSNNRR